MAAHQLTQGQMVLKTGVSQATISKILNKGRTHVWPEVLVALAEGLDLDPVELLYAAAGREPPERPQRPLPPHLAALVELLGDDQFRKLAQALRKLPAEKREAVLDALWATIRAVE